MSKTRRLGLIVPWVGFALLAIAWIAYWNVAAHRARASVNEAVNALAADGAQAGFARLDVRGFPVLMRLEMRGAYLEPSDGAWRAETDQLDIHVNLLDPAHVIYEAPAPIAIVDSDGAQSTLDADKMIVSVRHRRGAIAQAGLEADGLTLDDPAKPGALFIRKLVANARPDPRQDGAYQLALDANEVRLARLVRSFEPFGHDIPVLHARVVFEHGATLLELAPNDPFRAWREAGGLARIEGLGLTWGPLEAVGQGEAGLDAQRRLEGDLTLTLPRPGPALTALGQSESVPAGARQVLRLAGALVGGEVNMDVTARNGILTLRGAPVRTLDPVY